MRLLSFISPELHWDIITRTWIGSGSVDLKAYPYFKFLLLEIGTWRANLSQQVRVLLGFMAVKCWSLIVAQFISGSCWTDASLRLEIKKKKPAPRSSVINLGLQARHKVENSIIQLKHPQNLCKHAIFNLYSCVLNLMHVWWRVKLCPESVLHANSWFWINMCWHWKSDKLLKDGSLNAKFTSFLSGMLVDAIIVHR